MRNHRVLRVTGRDGAGAGGETTCSITTGGGADTVTALGGVMPADALLVVAGTLAVMFGGSCVVACSSQHDNVRFDIANR